jgi:hypothetical protein
MRIEVRDRRTRDPDAQEARGDTTLIPEQTRSRRLVEDDAPHELAFGKCAHLREQRIAGATVQPREGSVASALVAVDQDWHSVELVGLVEDLRVEIRRPREAVSATPDPTIEWDWTPDATKDQDAVGQVSCPAQHEPSLLELFRVAWTRSEIAVEGVIERLAEAKLEPVGHVVSENRVTQS